MKLKTVSISMLVTLILMVSLTVPVWAAVVQTGGNIVNFGDTEVPQGSTVKHVLVIGGDAVIEGTINDAVTVLNGNLTLKPTASVREHAIVLGGNLLTEEGAQIGKGVFRIGGDFAFAGTLLAACTILASLWFVNALITASLLILPLIVGFGWRSGVEKMSLTMRDNFFKTVLVGFLGLMVVFLLIILLIISLIGIPAAILVLIFTFLALGVGLSGVCHALGCRLPLLPEREQIHGIRTIFSGAVIAVFLFNIPILGSITLLVISAISFGSLILAAYQKLINKREQR